MDNLKYVGYALIVIQAWCMIGLFKMIVYHDPVFTKLIQFYNHNNFKRDAYLGMMVFIFFWPIRNNAVVYFLKWQVKRVKK